MISRLEQLEKFLKQDPADTFTHYAIALEYVSLKKYNAAIAKFEEVITLNPNYVPAYHQLGLLYAQVSKSNDAVRALEMGIHVAEIVGDSHARHEMEDAIDELGF